MKHYLFSSQNRAVALLVEKESKHLGRLKNGPGWLFLFLLGGGEVKGMSNGTGDAKINLDNLYKIVLLLKHTQNFSC
jgi:hypothetical protein